MAEAVSNWLLQLPMQTTIKTRAWFAILQVLSVPLSSKPTILSSFWMKRTFSPINISSNKGQQYWSLSHIFCKQCWSAPSYGVGSWEPETELQGNATLFHRLIQVLWNMSEKSDFCIRKAYTGFRHPQYCRAGQFSGPIAESCKRIN